MGRPHKLNSEQSVRGQLAKVQEEILELYSGNGAALARAQDEGRRIVMDAVARGVVDERVADGLKQEIDNWGY